jgi:hypothetical protein
VGETKGKDRYEQAVDVCEQEEQVQDMSMESMYFINKDSTMQFQNYVVSAFSIFNDNYDFANDVHLDDLDFNYYVPLQKQLYKYCKYIMVQSQMEKEIPIICLLYIEKLMMKTSLLVNPKNWKRVTFISLVIASKVGCCGCYFF